MFDLQKLVQDGRLDEAYDALLTAIRASPGEVGLRLRFIEVCCLLARWDKAALHAEVVSELDRNSYFKVLRVLSLIRGEKEREDFLAGRALPGFMGEPPAWLVMLAEAYKADVLQAGSGLPMRAIAREQTPVSSGRRDKTAFTSIEDLHPHFAVVLEVIVNARYFWVPFSQLAFLRVDPPRAHMDLVWARTTLGLKTGSEVAAFVPVRYPGTVALKNPDLTLSRMTTWIKDAAGERPVGLRWFSVGSAELSLHELGEIEFDTSS